MFKQLSILGYMRDCRAFEGVGYLAQCRMLLKLLAARGNLGITDFYRYRLYVDGGASRDKLRSYLGWRQQESLAKALNDPRGTGAAWDKTMFDLVLQGTGVRLAPLKAVYRPGMPPPLDTQRLGSEDELLDFLRNPGSYPMFAKAAFSQQGLHTFAMTSLDEGADSIRFPDGGSIAVHDFVENVVRHDRQYYRAACGYMFQEVLRQEASIVQRVGTPAICGARIVLCREAPGHPRFLTAIWKIAARGKVHDNFQGGSSGGYVAAIDLRSGTVSCPVRRYYPAAAAPAERAAAPDIEGFALPDWQQALEQVRQAADHFPLMNIQHWDVAFTEDGPVLLEVNDRGTIEFLQLHGTGFVDAGLKEMLRRRKAALHAHETDPKDLAFIDRL